MQYKRSCVQAMSTSRPMASRTITRTIYNNH
uniref:Uncharacterized protein n=1 Tax=Rhizophora mucronata TaxID=61149 RepID=A0A2P2P2R9_RHIMU